MKYSVVLFCPFQGSSSWQGSRKAIEMQWFNKKEKGAVCFAKDPVWGNLNSEG